MGGLNREKRDKLDLNIREYDSTRVASISDFQEFTWELRALMSGRIEPALEVTGKRKTIMREVSLEDWAKKEEIAEQGSSEMSL